MLEPTLNQAPISRCSDLEQEKTADGLLGQQQSVQLETTMIADVFA